jgi:hypothetical protein
MPPTGNKNHIANLEHHPGFRAKKVISYVGDGKGNAVMPVSNDLALRYAIDSVTNTVSYLGKAFTGTATNAASWQIKKINEASGVVITWADGNSDFDNVWDNRESLSYS